MTTELQTVPVTTSTLAPDAAPRRGLRARLLRRADASHAPRAHPVARPKRNVLATLREWHKRLGLFAFAFMGWLGFSGILINQSADWGYDTVRIDWAPVMWLYGLHPEAPRSGFAADGHWLAVTADHTLLDAQPLAERIDAPLGLVAGGSAARPLLFVATASSVVLLTTDGARYDELRAPILPVANVRRIGRTADGAVAVQDLDAFQSRDGGDSWTPVDPQQVRWSAVETLAEAQREQLLPYARPSVSLEHVLVDAHSGRLFGGLGAWIVNFVGLAAIGLSISGIWMWWRIRSNRRPAGRPVARA
ncbi:PepSY-associated TM helix domain-containing protein [Fontimonas sp. SYSU GA230001]|uniref:PepSY-associated TM helix domain-containing protein n=1 Tax=Fontimonas sp. SYSU GA230001 TaxID=3142450 RepID=UPI0032B3CCB8